MTMVLFIKRLPFPIQKRCGTNITYKKNNYLLTSIAFISDGFKTDGFKTEMGLKRGFKTGFKTE